jgi:glycosyl transferase family 25
MNDHARSSMKQAINTFFDRVVVINLPARTDRHREMGEQFQHIGLRLDSPGVEVFQAVRPDDAAGFSSIGARGCFLSHLQVLRQASAAGVSSLLILEDDLNFCAGFADRFDALADFLAQRDWGLCYGSYLLHAPLAHAEAPCVQVAPCVLIGTSAFLAVNGKHIGTLLAYFEDMLARPPGAAQGGPMHIDGAYCWFRQSHPDVTTWLAAPALGFQRASRTDVHRLRWFDRLPWAAGAMARLRRWRNGRRS